MSDKIQRVLESFIPEILNYKNKEEFNDYEIQLIIKNRRHYESLINGIDNSNRNIIHYKKYIEYEKTLLELRELRNNLNKNDLQVLHIIKIYKASIRFFNNFDMFNELINFSLKYNICIKNVIIKWFKLNLNNINGLYFCINKLIDQFFLIPNNKNLQLHEIETIRDLCIQITKIYPKSQICLIEFIKIEKRLEELFKEAGLIDISIECKEIITLLSNELNLIKNKEEYNKE